MVLRAFLGAILLAALSACGSVVVPPGQGPAGGADAGAGGQGPSLDDAPAEVRRGAELFAAHCQACHGPSAAGGAAYAGSLQGRSGIVGQVRSGGGGMPAFSAAQIDEAGVAAIEAWLAWLAAPGNGDGAGLGGDVPPFVRHCAGCHGATGEGSALAPQIRSPHGGYATWIVRNGRRSASSLGYPQDMPAFGGELLPGAELEEILTFLHEQPMPGDGARLYARFCGNCHGPDGRGGVVGESARDEADDRDDFHEVIREGKGGNAYGARRDFMPARLPTELREGEIEKIRAFLRGGRVRDDDDDDDAAIACSAAGSGGGAASLALALAALLLRAGAVRARRPSGHRSSAAVQASVEKRKRRPGKPDRRFSWLRGQDLNL